MTRRAGQTRIIRVVRFAHKKSIRLKTDGIYVFGHIQNLFKTDMTRAAKILRLFKRGQMRRIKNLQIFRLIASDGGNMIFARSVTRFAADRFAEMFGLKFFVRNRAG